MIAAKGIVLLFLFAVPMSIANSCHPQCAYCVEEQNACLACKSNYELALADSSCHESTIENCQLYGMENECLKCRSTFTLINGKCVKTYDGCINSAQNSVCYQCGYSTILQGISCKGVINCQIFSQVCQQCRSNYELVSNVCIDISQGCEEANPLNGICIKCKNGYQMSGYQCIKNQKINPRCQAHKNQTNCYICKSGYRQENGLCLLPDETFAEAIAAATIINCKVINPQNVLECLICVYGFYPSGNQCKKVSSLCKVHNVQNGRCQSCKSVNHQLSDGKCLDPSCQVLIGNGDEGCQQCASGFIYDSVQYACKFYDTNCRNAGPKQCLQCKDGYYLNLQGKCNILPANCLAAQPTGTCYNCVTGYQLSSGVCQYFQQTNTTDPPIDTINNQPNNAQQTLDPNCLSFNGNFCTKCSSRYYVYGDGKCVPVNPSCDGYNLRGECTSCYKGYQVNAGKCVIQSPKDPYCKSYNGNACIQCYSGFFYSQQDKACKRLNPLCKTSNLINGYCMSCYQGYIIDPNTGSCIVFFKDPNCMDQSGDKCLQCSKGFYLGTDGKCAQVNPLCKTSSQNGACLTCFPGYILSGRDCEIGADKDPNCKTFNGVNCIQCFDSYFLQTGTRKCIKADPLCKTFDLNNGNCLTCYNGYEVRGSSCEFTTKDPNCKTFNGGQCIECFEGYFVTSGKCNQQKILCKQINKSNGQCTNCWQGYTLSEGDCKIIVSNNPTGQQQDLYCINYQNNQCTKCSNGFYLETNTKKCKQVDPLCKESNPNNGSCTSCYLGYSLSEGACIAKITVSTVPNCVKFTPAGLCTQCLDGYYVSKNNSCTAVSILCSKYNKMTGQCLSCIPGYFFQDNQCIYPAIQDANCIRYSGAYCDTCRNGYYLSSYLCKQIHAQCSAFDYSRLVCLTCLNNYTPKGAGCV